MSPAEISKMPCSGELIAVRHQLVTSLLCPSLLLGQVRPRFRPHAVWPQSKKEAAGDHKS